MAHHLRFRCDLIALSHLHYCLEKSSLQILSVLKKERIFVIAASSIPKRRAKGKSWCPHTDTSFSCERLKTAPSIISSHFPRITYA